VNVLYTVLLGLGLGLRHATDPDHVIVVSSLLQREPGVRCAARVAALWGAGHSLTFLGLGLAIVGFGLRVPAQFEWGAEVLVALMLLACGVWNARSTWRLASSQGGRAADFTAARPVFVGIVHGAAGSVGIALLAASTFGSRVLALLYLGLFGFGTVLGMVLLTVVLALPLEWSARNVNSQRVTAGAAALLSIGLGALMLTRLL
jgi:hypothetical protein